MFYDVILLYLICSILFSVYGMKAVIVLDALGELTTLITWIEGEYWVSAPTKDVKIYFTHIMANLFGIKSYRSRYKVIPSRGMIHWHGMGWREDRQPHQLL